MSKSSRMIFGVILLGLAAAPMYGQLRERSRLKAPLLRLPNLSQRQKANPASATPTAPGTAAFPAQSQAPDNIVRQAQVPASPATAMPGATQTPVPGVFAATPPLTSPAQSPLPSAPAASLVPSSPTAPNSQPVTPIAATQTPLPMAQSLPAAAPVAAPKQPVSVASMNPVGRVSTTTNPVAPPTTPAQITPRQMMDLALADAEKALQYMKSSVRDYTCSFVKRERVNGQLLATETANLKIRNRVVENGRLTSPLSVYMKFVGPRDVKGREVIFVEGANREKMICKEGGTKGRFLPAIWLKQNSSFIMSTNRYPISQIGMIRLAERLIENGYESPVDDCNVKYIHGAKVDGRTCSYLEVIRPTPRPGLPVGHNNVNYAQVFIDTELQMPIRFVAYDWPSQPGGSPRLIEQYTYRNIQVNVGLTDDDFEPKNPKYNF